MGSLYDLSKQWCGGVRLRGIHCSLLVFGLIWRRVKQGDRKVNGQDLGMSILFSQVRRVAEGLCRAISELRRSCHDSMLVVVCGFVDQEVYERVDGKVNDILGQLRPIFGERGL